MEDAEDAVQEAFLRVHQYEQNHQIRSEEGILVTVATNVSIDQLRRRQLAPFERRQRNLTEIFDSAPGPYEILYAKVRLQRAYEGLQHLNERTRRILLARRLDNISVAEIAKREGMTVAAVEKQIARATLKLMTWMEGW